VKNSVKIISLAFVPTMEEKLYPVYKMNTDKYIMKISVKPNHLNRNIYIRTEAKVKHTFGPSVTGP
jgi:hypothetical protein